DREAKRVNAVVHQRETSNFALILLFYLPKNTGVDSAKNSGTSAREQRDISDRSAADQRRKSHKQRVRPACHRDTASLALRAAADYLCSCYVLTSPTILYHARRPRSSVCIDRRAPRGSSGGRVRSSAKRRQWPASPACMRPPGTAILAASRGATTGFGPPRRSDRPLAPLCRRATP